MPEVCFQILSETIFCPVPGVSRPIILELVIEMQQILCYDHDDRGAMSITVWGNPLPQNSLHTKGQACRDLLII